MWTASNIFPLRFHCQQYISDLEEKYCALFDFANTKNYAKLSEIIDFIMADVISGSKLCT
jgi:hypothetical protein